jgi:hypothetical protein
LIEKTTKPTGHVPSHKEKKSPAPNPNNKNLILFVVIQWRKKGNTSCLLQSCDSEPDPVVHHHHPTKRIFFFFEKNSAQFSFDSVKKKNRIFSGQKFNFE